MQHYEARQRIHVYSLIGLLSIRIVRGMSIEIVRGRMPGNRLQHGLRAICSSS